MIAVNVAFISRFAREALIVALAYFLYYVVRSGASERAADAFHNADQVIKFEMGLGVFRELTLQTATLSHDALMHLSNFAYVYSHWPVMIAVAVWLFLRRPQLYYLIRNAFLITAAIALVVYFAFPVAPPWRVTDDVVYALQYSPFVARSSDSALGNPYAAVPSLRVGVDLLLALGLFLAFPGSKFRYLFFLFPLMAWTSTVTTGMHYIIDGAAGMCVASIAFLSSAGLHRTWQSVDLKLPAWVPRI